MSHTCPLKRLIGIIPRPAADVLSSQAPPLSLLAQPFTVVLSSPVYAFVRRTVETIVSNECIAVRKVATPLREELTCHIGSHSVTCHPAEAAFPPLPQPKLVVD